MESRMKYKSEIEDQFRKFIARSEEEFCEGEEIDDDWDWSNEDSSSDGVVPHHTIDESIILVTFLNGYESLTDNELWEGLMTNKLKDMSIRLCFTQVKIIEEKKFDTGFGYIGKVVEGNFEQLAYNRYPDHSMGFGEKASFYDLGLNGIWHLVHNDTKEPYSFPSYELFSAISELKSIKHQRVAKRLIQQVSEHFNIDKELVKKVLKILK